MEKPGFTSRSERGEKAKVCAKVSEKEFGTNFSLGKTGGEHLVSGFSWDAGKLDQTIVVLINTTRKKRGAHSGSIIFLVRSLSQVDGEDNLRITIPGSLTDHKFVLRSCLPSTPHCPMTIVARGFPVSSFQFPLCSVWTAVQGVYSINSIPPN